MREVAIQLWCDGCWQDEEARTQATHTYTIGIIEGEARPALKVLLTCDVHAKPVAELLGLLGKAEPLPPPVPPGKAKPKTAAAGYAAEVQRLAHNNNYANKLAATRAPAGARQQRPSVQPTVCPVCQDPVSGRGSLIGHIWSQHRADDKPPSPLICPDCGFSGEVQGVGTHRAMRHGYDPVAEALSGVPGFR